MTASHSSSNLAILVANGFEENHITAAQKILTKHKISYKMIAPEQGLVNGWQGAGWGHYFTVDDMIGSALGSDYDALILVGGARGVEKLRANPHTRRIVNHFMEAGKPVAAIGEAVGLLALSSKSAGLEVSCPESAAKEIEGGRIVRTAESQKRDGLILTANGADVDAWADALVDLVTEASSENQQAA